MLEDFETYLKISDTSDLDWLFALTKHPEHYVRARVAYWAPMFQARFFECLAHDTHHAVRANVVSNHTTSPRQSELIYRAEFSKPREEMSVFLLQVLASKPGMSEAVYQRLYDLDSWCVSIALAHNSSCLKNILKKFAKLPVEMKAVGRNYAGYDTNKEIRMAARRRLGLPIEETEYELNTQ